MSDTDGTRITLKWQWDEIVLQDLLSGPTARPDAVTILSTRPFFIKYLHSVFEDGFEPRTKVTFTIASHISDAIGTIENSRYDDLTSIDVELRRKRYKDALLESIADTAEFPLHLPVRRSDNPGFSDQAKLYGGLILASLIGDKILEQVSDPNMYHYYFGTPLAAAARRGHLAAAELLLQRGAKVTVPPCYSTPNPPRLNRLPLVVACFKGYEDVVRLLLKYSNNLQDLSGHITYYNSTPHGSRRTVLFNDCINAAFRGRHLVIVRIMMESEILPISDTKQAVFYAAAENGSVEMIKSMIESGFDSSNEDYWVRSMRFPLEGAALKNKVAALKLLLQLGFAKRPRGYGRVLHQAAVRGNLEVAKVVFEDAPHIFTPPRYRSLNHMLKSPLQLALWKGREEVLEYLLNVTGRKGLEDLGPRVLSGLSHEGKTEMIRIILEAGGDPNSLPPRYKERTALPPILVAMRQGNQELVDLLMSYGANY